MTTKYFSSLGKKITATGEYGNMKSCGRMKNIGRLSANEHRTVRYINIFHCIDQARECGNRVTMKLRVIRYTS